MSAVRATPSAASLNWRDRGLALLMLTVALACAWWQVPDAQDARQRTQLPLESLVPARFGSWRLDPVAAGMVRPAVEAAKAYEMYDQVLERVYMDDAGERVMVSVAYGRRQSVGLQMHRPEVCYRTGGFAVSAPQAGQLLVNGKAMPVTRLVAQMPGRNEPITYWRLLGDRLVVDDSDFRWAQFKSGVRRAIPDGMLFRVSTIDASPARAYAIQTRFVQALDAALSPAQRARLMGLPDGATAP
jgi:EpsI family protein